MVNSTFYAEPWILTIISFFFGWLWYGPLFGKVWARENGLDKKKKPEMSPYKLAYHFLTTLVFVSVLSMVYYAVSIPAVLWVIPVWLGFFVMTRLSSMIWTKQSWKLLYIDMAYQLLNMLIITSILEVLG